MSREVASQIHFDQVGRQFDAGNPLRIGVSSDEIVGLLGSIYPLGIWRLEIDNGLMYWNKDAFHIHGMECSEDPVNLSEMLTRYHADDAALIEQLIESATTQRNGFRYVMRVKNDLGGYRMIASAGRFRPDNGNELIGYFHEFQELVRSVVLTGD
jgi:hypothetical protein